MDNNILLKQKQTCILIALRDTSQNWNISNIAKITDTTYVHTCNFISKCEELGITSSEKHGKLKLIRLTEKGQKLAELVANISSIVNIQEQHKTAEQQK